MFFGFGNSKTFADCEFTCCVLELALARSSIVGIIAREMIVYLQKHSKENLLKMNPFSSCLNSITLRFVTKHMK